MRDELLLFYERELDSLLDGVRFPAARSMKIQGSAAGKQKLFDHICRLDLVQALRVG